MSAAAVVQFASVADHILETEERLTDLIDHLLEIGSRLDSLENTLVEKPAGEDPLATILARLDAFDNRLARLERHLRRPPPFPITVIENVDDHDAAQGRQGFLRPDPGSGDRAPPPRTQAITICTVCIRSRWPPSINGSIGAPISFAGCASGWPPSRRARLTKEPRHEGCLFADQSDENGDAVAASGQEIKRQSAPRPSVRAACDGWRQRGATAARDLGDDLGHARGWSKSERPGSVSTSGSSRMTQFARESAGAPRRRRQMRALAPVFRRRGWRGRVIPLRGHE